jgi:hypothetical protein
VGAGVGTIVAANLAMPRLLTVLGSALFGVLALSSVACNRVRVDDVRGPDGGDWKKLSCRHMDEKCYRTAAVLCPNGYYFARAAGPAPAVGPAVHDVDGDDESASAPRASGAQPKAGVNAKTLPPQEKWGRGMYSSQRGSILVQCAATTASR